MLLLRCFRLFIIILFSANLFCSKNLPTNIEDTLSHYFIYKDLPSQKTILSTIKTVEQLDSLFTSIKGKSATGPSFKELEDMEKNRFTLGYSTPKHFNNKEMFPLIIYLHGGIGTTRTDKGKEAWNMFQFLQDSMDLFIASPSANRECPWWTEAGLNRILISLRYMTLHFPIDPDRIFLAGVSDGGTACYAAANQTSSLFAGFFAISGFGAAVQNFGIQLQPQNLIQENIYNINADNDKLYPISYVNQFLTSLKSQGVNIKSKVYKNELHGFDYKHKETNELLYLLRMWRRNNTTAVSHIFSDNKFFFNPLISNLERDNRQNGYLNFYLSGDTINLRSENIKSFNLHINPNTVNDLYLKKSKKVKMLKEYKIKNLKNFNKIFVNTFHPKEYNRKVYHITLE